ncbi:MAG: CDP-alcohol phosphatidyltransferase family protein [Candidatus Pacebacteria bacterium]|nr:CDP-alcohol phosphatidyltransferase family protein [Candidatus Paceibacterota bacterium]
MLDAHRDFLKGFEKKVGKIFSFFPLSPNQYTISTIFFALAAFYFLYKNKIIFAIIFFIIAAFLDLVDGSVARYKNQATKKGAYLDTIVDRFVEAILIFGLLFLPLPEVLFPVYVWIFLILFGSLMTTYAKSAAKEKDLIDSELKGGLLARGERLILIIIAILLGIYNYYWTVYLLVLIAILTNFTVLQRIFSAINKSKN